MIPGISTRATVTWEESKTRSASLPFPLKVNKRTRNVCVMRTHGAAGCPVLRWRNENERSREGGREKGKKKRGENGPPRRERKRKRNGAGGGYAELRQEKERDGDAPRVTRQSWLRRVPWCVARLNINPKAKEGRRKRGEERGRAEDEGGGGEGGGVERTGRVSSRARLRTQRRGAWGG